VATATTDAPFPPAAPRKRPIAATLVAIIAVIWSGVLTASVVRELLDWDRGDGVPWPTLIDVGFAALALLVAFGSFTVKRWGWALFMSWATFALTINLLRVFFLHDPRYIALVVGTLTVFLLTPRDVQVAFGVRNPPNIRLGASVRNPIDSS
jgi:hypothetical protein